MARRSASPPCNVCGGTTHHFFGCPKVNGSVDDVPAARAAYLAERDAELAAYEAKNAASSAPPAPSLTEAPCYATARTPGGDVYVNLAIGVRGGLPWFWADCPMPYEYPWKSTAELEALGAVVISVPHEVSRD